MSSKGTPPVNSPDLQIANRSNSLTESWIQKILARLIPSFMYIKSSRQSDPDSIDELSSQQTRPTSKQHLFQKSRLARNLLTPFLIAAFVMLVIVGSILYFEHVSLVFNEAKILGIAIQRQVEADRAYYTKNVVERALENQVNVTNDFRAHKGAIPLPATFVREVAERLTGKASSTEYRLDLRSLHPINPDKGPRNEVEKKFLALNSTEGKVQEQTTTVDGKTFYTLYVPDKAHAEACVHCHNNLQNSPKTDYELGDVMGTLMISIPLTERLDKTLDIWVIQIVAFAVILLISTSLIYLCIHRSVIRPISALAETATEMATGNLAARIRINSDDEIGQLALAYNRMIATIRQMVDREFVARQAIDSTVTSYIGFIERVMEGDLTHRLSTQELDSNKTVEAKHLVEFAEDLNQMIDRWAGMANQIKDIGDHAAESSVELLETASRQSQTVSEQESLLLRISVMIEQQQTKTASDTQAIEELAENLRQARMRLHDLTQLRGAANGSVAHQTDVAASIGGRSSETAREDTQVILDQVERTAESLAVSLEEASQIASQITAAARQDIVDMTGTMEALQQSVIRSQSNIEQTERTARTLAASVEPIQASIVRYQI